MIETILGSGMVIDLLITTSPEQSKEISGYEDLKGFAEKRSINVYTPQRLLSVLYSFCFN
jgi:hypothetical protein